MLIQSSLLKGQPCVVSTCTDGPIVLLPPRSIKWIVQQPRHMLDFMACQSDRLSMDYTLANVKIALEPTCLNIFHKILTRNSGSTIAEIYEELQQTCNQELGLDTKQWKSVCLYDCILDQVGAISNRMLIGLPLCTTRSTPFV